MTTRPATKDLPEECRTRPGTPTIGLDSTSQMDDFYAALARGEARPSGRMNLYQYFYIAERCRPGAKVLDVYCGRGPALPLLCHYAPHIQQYVGLGISSDNLREAYERVGNLELPRPRT
jgi:2-polyprenyl-3-methyl-5-hydroxy-6-metoxy-1,4-benzoquinol methylase